MSNYEEKLYFILYKEFDGKLYDEIIDWISDYHYLNHFKPNYADHSIELIENVLSFKKFNKYKRFFLNEEVNKTTKWHYLEKWYKQYKSLFNIQTDFE